MFVNGNAHRSLMGESATEEGLYYSTHTWGGGGQTEGTSSWHPAAGARRPTAGDDGSPAPPGLAASFHRRRRGSSTGSSPAHHSCLSRRRPRRARGKRGEHAAAPPTPGWGEASVGRRPAPGRLRRFPLSLLVLYSGRRPTAIPISAGARRPRRVPAPPPPRAGPSRATAEAARQQRPPFAPPQASSRSYLTGSAVMSPLRLLGAAGWAGTGLRR